MPAGSLFLLAAAVAAALLGHLGAVAAQALAARGRMLDQPGAHRMHTTPIPRGGGIGFAAALLLFGIAPNLAVPQVDHWQGSALLLGAAVILVALVGWVDDHRGLPAWPRLAAHLAAGACVAGAWFIGASGMDAADIAIVALVVVATAASINLHNFFDGADGLLASQCLFVATILSCLAWRAGHMPLAAISVSIAGGVAGFLPSNAPRARVFMGDAGSGTIGLGLAAACLLALRDDVITLPMVLILASGCLVDTGMTLASRVLRGRRFWQRHREHLYQWLVRSGWTHPRVVATWLAWNLVVVLPSVLCAWRAPAAGWIFAAIVYALGMSIWILAKRRLRLRVRRPR